MTRPSTRKEFEVWQACDELLSKGFSVKEITGEAIAVRLRELGFKAGGLTQRYRYRDSWMLSRGLSREHEVDARLSSSDPIERGVAVFREGLEREVKKEYENRYRLLEDTIIQKEQKINEFEVVSNELNEKLVLITQQYEDLTRKYQMQSQDWQNIHEQNISYKATIEQLERQAKQKELEFTVNTSQQKAQFDETLNLLKASYEAQLLEGKSMLSNMKENLDAAQKQVPALTTMNSKITDFMENISNYFNAQSQEFLHISESLSNIPILKKMIDESETFKTYFSQKISHYDGLFNEIICKLDIVNESIASEIKET